MKNERIKAVAQAEDPAAEAVFQIGQLLHWKMTTAQLKTVRDMVISQKHRSWNKKSFLGKALIYHWGNANSSSGDIKYHDLLLAELIRNFSIATKLEYLEKCKEFRIYPFVDKKIKTLPNQNESPSLTVEQQVLLIKNAFDEMSKEIENEIKDEVDNAMKQDFPICSFDELKNKKNLN